MRAGQMDRRIVIEVNTPTRSGTGAEKESWGTFATVWAEVRSPRGKEFFNADQVTAVVDAVFIVRHRTDLTTKMRISHDGKLYDIHFIGALGRQKGLEIMASAQGV